MLEKRAKREEMKLKVTSYQDGKNGGGDLKRQCRNAKKGAMNERGVDEKKILPKIERGKNTKSSGGGVGKEDSQKGAAKLTSMSKTHFMWGKPDLKIGTVRGQFEKKEIMTG